MDSALPICDKLVDRLLHDIKHVELCFFGQFDEQVADHWKTHDPEADPADVIRKVAHFGTGTIADHC